MLTLLSHERRHPFYMTVEKKPKAKAPKLDQIAQVVGDTVGKVYGIVGLVPSKTIVDEINIFLKKENYKDGISVRITRNGSYEITIFSVLAYGVKANEVIVELQNQIKYALEKRFKIPFTKVNVFVRDIK